MPTPASVQEQLTDILVRVVGCAAGQVVPAANLKSDLLVDSLTVVEMGDELGRRFGIYLSDDAIDGFVTVQDAVDAVAGDAAATATVQIPVAAPTPQAVFAPTPPRAVPPALAPKPWQSSDAREKRRGKAESFAFKLALFGAGLGIVLGLGGSALVSASGIGGVDLPPLLMPTSDATTATPEPSPTPTPANPSTDPEPTFEVSSTRVPPGERFRLEGSFPALGAGALLQVQVKDPGAEWDDFPVTTKTRDGGSYSTQIYTSRTGEREFRMIHKASGKATRAITVEIG